MADNSNKTEKPELREISDEELKKILEEHDKWLKSDKQEGTQADLSFTDLKRKDFLKLDLREANFQRANLSDADLRDSDLEEINFTEAILNNAKLQGAYLKSAILIRASLRQTTLQSADLSNANLSEAKLPLAILKDIVLNEANLHKAILQRADLSGAKIQNAKLKEANLQQADLHRADLYGADLKETNLIVANLTESNLTNVDIRGADLRSALFENCNVTGMKYNRKGRYRGIRVDSCYGGARFKRFAQDQSFIEELKESGGWGTGGYYFWRIIVDCGRTPWMWLFWLVFLSIYFGVVFFWMGLEAFHVKPPLPDSPITYLYYSVVTMTTLGFGDITPKIPSAARWVMAEVIIGYVMLGGLISFLGNVIFRRS